MNLEEWASLDTDLLGEGAAPLMLEYFARLLDCLNWFTVDKLQVIGQADKWGIPQLGNLEAEAGGKEITCQGVGWESWWNSTRNCLVARAVELDGKLPGPRLDSLESCQEAVLQKCLWDGPGEAGRGAHGTCWMRSSVGTSLAPQEQDQQAHRTRKKSLFVLQSLSASSTGKV